jgi:hypothetical protein
MHGIFFFVTKFKQEQEQEQDEGKITFPATIFS